ncbi:MAG: hypothetical protein CM1200mP6_08080 [Anaerolineaceae bacterium]|nr:MAG: hypothetical protein CM1200mP6_08080 [Anaerolineaceae bacterium]
MKVPFSGRYYYDDLVYEDGIHHGVLGGGGFTQPRARIWSENVLWWVELDVIFKVTSFLKKDYVQNILS